MATAKSVITLAKKQLGKDGGKFNDYIGFPRGTDWCGAFVHYLMRKCKVKMTVPGAGLAENWCRWGKANKRVVKMKDAKPGDIVTFDWDFNHFANHVGIVLKNHGNGLFTCIEGNTGDPARVRIMVRQARFIRGVIRPRYDKPKKPKMRAEIESGQSTPTAPEKAQKKSKKKSGIALPARGYFRKGDKGDKVKHLQMWLKVQGFAPGKIDGVLGSKTVKAVGRFQKKYKLTVDGIFGKKCLKVANKIK